MSKQILASWVAATSLALGLGAAYAGPLNPPAGAVAGTNKTLQSIEPRIDLLNPPAGSGVTTAADAEIVITQAGSYYLSGNLTVTKTIGIKIQVSGVTLDLNGFSIFRNGSSGDGIQIVGNWDPVTITNGVIRGFASGINGSGVGGTPARACLYKDLDVNTCQTGFNVGETSTLVNCRATFCTAGGILTKKGCVLENCSAQNCQGGSAIGVGPGTTLINCTTNTNTTTYGIFADNNCTLSGCTVTEQTGLRGINAGNSCTLTNCTANGNSVVWGIFASDGCTLSNCTASGNTHTGTVSGGFGLNASCTLTNCSASNNTSTATASTTTGLGINTGSHCTLLNCVANYNRGSGIASLFTVIRGCTASNNGGNGIEVPQRGQVVDCQASNNSLNGIKANFVGLIKNSIFSANAINGILIDSSGGVEVSGCTCEENGNNATTQGAGIKVTGAYCRIKDNHVYVNWRGIEVPTGVVGVLIVGNTSANNNSGVNFLIATGNKVGTIVSAPASGAINGNTGGAGVGSTDPWANISY
jgi:hypothetical protein